MEKREETQLLLAAPLSFLRRNLAFSLQREGLDVTIASDGREALHLARMNRPTLIIADADLPGISGFGVCQCIKEDPELSHLPVLLYSQSPPSDFRDKAWASGAYDVLNVPFEAHEILEKVSHAVIGLPTLHQAAEISLPGASTGVRSAVTAVFEGKRLILEPPVGSLDEAVRMFPRNTKANLTFTDGTFTATQWHGNIRKITSEGIEVYLEKLVAREQRRQAMRKSVSLPARYRLPGDFYRLASVVNLSVGGMRLAQLRGHVSVGMIVEFSLAICNRPVTLQGEVRWLKEGAPSEFDCGVSFIGMDGPSREILYDYLFASADEEVDAPVQARKDAPRSLWRKLEELALQAEAESSAVSVTEGLLQRIRAAVGLLEGFAGLVEDNARHLEDPTLSGLVDQVVREIEQLQGQSVRLRKLSRQALGA